MEIEIKGNQDGKSAFFFKWEVENNDLASNLFT